MHDYAGAAQTGIFFLQKKIAFCVLPDKIIP
jgi:hypothetical protein